METAMNAQSTIESLLNGSNPKLNDLVNSKKNELNIQSATTIRVDSTPRTKNLSQINNELIRLADEKKHIEEKISTIKTYVDEQMVIAQEKKDKILEEFNNSIQKVILELGGNTKEAVVARIAQHKYYLEQLESRLAEGNFEEPTDEFLNSLANIIAKKDKRYDKIILQFDKWAEGKIANELEGKDVAGKPKRRGLYNSLKDIESEIVRLEGERNKVIEVKSIDEKYETVKDDVDVILGKTTKTEKPKKVKEVKEISNIDDDDLSDEISKLLKV